MTEQETLKTLLEAYAFNTDFIIEEIFTETTIEVGKSDLIGFLTFIRSEPKLAFDQLTDIAGVDYLHYGQDEWSDKAVNSGGYSRAVNKIEDHAAASVEKRFGVTYQFLSLTHNRRLRVKVRLSEADPTIESICHLWPAANWYEREAFDLFGIIFVGHPDLRRILTDYGFVGHPFRKDFPLVGEVEMRYDAKAGTCVYEKVSIEPRVLAPKIIRKDSRYAVAEESENE